jgi:hypothetical protein
MLTLLLNRFPRRRIVGLLALREWGPATGAITQSVATEQAGQQSLASGTVVAPVQTGGGLGGGAWIPLRPRTGRVTPLEIPAITGSVRSAQARQESIAFGEMIDTELEMVVAILMAAD